MYKEAVLTEKFSAQFRTVFFTVCEYFSMSISCLIISLLKTSTALL